MITQTSLLNNVREGPQLLRTMTSSPSLVYINSQRAGELNHSPHRLLLRSVTTRTPSNFLSRHERNKHDSEDFLKE